MTLGELLHVSGADSFLLFCSFFPPRATVTCLYYTVFPPHTPVWTSRGHQSALLSASASMCLSFRLQSITLSFKGSRVD